MSYPYWFNPVRVNSLSESIPDGFWSLSSQSFKAKHDELTLTSEDNINYTAVYNILV